MKKNEVYRFLNWEGCQMEEKNRSLFKAYIEEVISPFGGSCSVSSKTYSNLNYISFKITFPNYSNKYAEICFPSSGSSIGRGEIVFNETRFNSVFEYFGNFTSSTPDGGCLIVPMNNGGVISVPTVYSRKEDIPCLSTYANYLIFTWAQDIRTQEKFPCILYEYTLKDYAIPHKRIRGLLFQDNNSNFDDYFSLEIQNRQTVRGSSTANDFTEKYPYPVLSQMTIPFDQYIFPDLFKKETGAECDFGAVLIQKKKYFLTNHFAFKMTE